MFYQDARLRKERGKLRLLVTMTKEATHGAGTTISGNKNSELKIPDKTEKKAIHLLLCLKQLIF